MLTDEEIKTMLEQSFKPFRCIVEISGEGQIRFRILSWNVRIYREPGFALSDLRDYDQFAALVTRVRKVLEARGHHPDPL